MNKKEADVLSKTVEAITMVSDRLDTVFKAVEVIQKHIISQASKITYDTRVDMFKDKHSDDCECNSCDVPFKSDKNPFVETFELHRQDINDNTRRLDRLEELVCVLISIIKGPNDYLKNRAKEIYEEQAVAKGDCDE